MRQLTGLIACGAILRSESGYLLVSHSKPSAAGKFSLPGGRVEPRESVVETVCREVHEETGLIVNVVGIVCVFERPQWSDEATVAEFIFEVALDSGRLRVSKPHPVVDFFDLPTIRRMDSQDLLRYSGVRRSVELFETRGSSSLSVIETLLD